MTPAPEPFLAAPDAAPSLLWAALRMGLVLTLIGVGAWAWLYWYRRVKGPERLVEVLDRAALARGASVALLRVGERRLLVGVSAEGVRLLRDLRAGDAEPARPPFAEVLADASERREVRR